MAHRRAVSHFGRPALRWLVSQGEGVSSSGFIETAQAVSGRAPGGQSALPRPISTSFAARAEGATASSTEAAGAAFERAKKAPLGLYASIGGAFGAAAGVYYLLFGGAKPEVQAEASHGLGSAHIGEYSVRTHMGAQFTQDELYNDFAIVYFGKVSDRECVTELEKLSEIVQQSDRKTNMHFLNPLFVTLDYENDSEEKLRNVVELFNSNHNRNHMRLTGLTGPDTAKLHQAAVEYSGEYSDKSGPRPDQPDDQIYLVNPEGEFVTAYKGNVSVADISDDLYEIIRKYKINHPTWHSPKKVARRHA